MQLWQHKNRLVYRAGALALTLGLAACGGGTATDTATDTSATGEEVSGVIEIDGSSTVFPISELMAEEFSIANPGVDVSVGVSGSGGGFKKFCSGETDISNPSRQIKDEEIANCEAAGVEFYEIPVAYDGITIVTNPENDFLQCVTVEQLNAMWSPEAEGQVTSWDQVDPEFPAQELALFGPGTDSGTFDYFTDEVNGEEGASRGDYTASEDDNVIVTGVTSSAGSVGYFGYAYYEENQDGLKALEIENEDGECIAPSSETIADGSYNPMSRPLFFYVKKEAYETKPQVKAFVDYQLDPANGELVSLAGYIPLPDEDLASSKSRIEEDKLGKDPV